MSIIISQAQVAKLLNISIKYQSNKMLTKILNANDDLRPDEKTLLKVSKQQIKKDNIDFIRRILSLRDKFNLSDDFFNKLMDHATKLDREDIFDMIKGDGEATIEPLADNQTNTTINNSQVITMQAIKPVDALNEIKPNVVPAKQVVPLCTQSFYSITRP